MRISASTSMEAAVSWARHQVAAAAREQGDVHRESDRRGVRSERGRDRVDLTVQAGRPANRDAVPGQLRDAGFERRQIGGVLLAQDPGRRGLLPLELIERGVAAALGDLRVESSRRLERGSRSALAVSAGGAAAASRRIGFPATSCTAAPGLLRVFCRKAASVMAFDITSRIACRASCSDHRSILEPFGIRSSAEQ